MPTAADKPILIAGRDAEFRRFLPEASPDPEPAAVVLNAEREIVGWIDYDVGRSWLSDDEVNIGYGTHPEDRGRGIATRALGLLVSFLAGNDDCATATLLIDPANAPSIAVARHAGFRRHRDIEGELLFKRSVR